MSKDSKSIIVVVSALVLVVVFAGMWWFVSKDRKEMFPPESSPNSVQAASTPRSEPVVRRGESGVNSEPAGANRPLSGNANEPSTLPVQPSAVSKHSLRSDLLTATASQDPKMMAAQTADGIDFLKEFLWDKTLPLAARKHAAQALMRSGSEDSVQGVVAAAINEFQSGKPDDGGAILSSLHVPVGIEGAKGLLNVLLGQDDPAISSGSLPVEVQSTLRKTLRSASDAEEIGSFMAQLYSDMQSSGHAANANELLNGVAHPAMLSELVVQAQLQGLPDQVSGLFDRLIAADDPGVVAAMARLVSKQPALLNEASEALFNWSLEHPQQAQPGLFAEFLSNQELPPEQRVVAAYGLAGLIGKVDALRALGKSISSETDQETRQYLQNALLNLQSAEQPDPPKISPTK
jgi:hypothetical protein